MLFPELSWCQARVFFEKTDEVGSIVEMENVGDFADSLFRVEDVSLGLEYELRSDDFARAFSEVLATCSVQVLRRGVEQGSVFVHQVHFRAFF